MSDAKNPPKPPTIGVIGWKNSGKTTLAVRLIACFVERGLDVVSIKHAHHAFQIDDGATDSARHRKAGARRVAIVSPDRWALVEELRGAPEPDFDDVVGMLGACDLVVVEGYKSARMPKIEARRQDAADRSSLAARDPNVIAIAADYAVDDAAIPVFALDDIDAIADFVAGVLDLKSRTGTRRAGL